MDLTTALGWASSRKSGVLITIRADGRPQSSDITFVPEGDTFVISVTADRAKTLNMRRDPRVVLHISEPHAWSYIAFDGTAELSAVTVEPGDETSDRLVALYEAARGEPHPDWAEYRQAMVDQQRLVCTVRPTSAVGLIN
jgi:PPOX class probable F420-dependent enzyme